MIATVAMLTACGNRDNSAPQFAGAIAISSPSGSIGVTGTMQFSAVVTDDHGNVLTVKPVWSVVAGGGTIDSTGLFTAGDTAGVFEHTIVATIGAVTSSSTVTVTAGPLATITVTPSTVTLAAGATQQFTAVGHDAGNNVVAIAPTWSVASGGGTINGTGLFTAGTVAGTFTNSVTATSGSISGTSSVVVSAGALATITVSPGTATLAIGATQQYAAVGKDANGNIVAITPAWHVAASGGTINSATGLFTAGTVSGTFTNTVVAQVGVCASAIVGTASAIVSPGALAEITISPSTVTLAPSATQQYTASGSDANGNAVPVTPTWSVVAGGGTISGTGLFTAGTTSGTYASTVTATSGLVSAHATVTVAAGALATITVTPATASLTIGATQQYTAVGKDANNNVVVITPTWSVFASGGTINSSTGMFTAGTGAGTFTNTVRATSGLIVGSASATVNPGALASMTLSPLSPVLSIGGTQQFTVAGKDANNNVVAVTPTWTANSTSGTITSAGGLFTAGTVAGSVSNAVTATSGSITASTSVQVSPGALASIVLTPATVTLAAGATQAYTAVGKDASNNVVTFTPAWSVAAGGGTISGIGVFTAGSTTGTFTNTVRVAGGASNAIVATATVTVATVQPASITVTPFGPTVRFGTTQQFTAVGRAFDGTIVSITPVWSADSAAGTIDSNGLFTPASGADGLFTNAISATQGRIMGRTPVIIDCGC